jgi:hypothetical protein
MTLLTESELPAATFGDLALSNAERFVCWQLATQALTHAAGVNAVAAQIALDQAVDRGATELVADAHTVVLLVDGEQLFAVHRAFVAAAARR